MEFTLENTDNAPDIGFAFCHNLKEKVMAMKVPILKKFVKNDYGIKNWAELR